MAKGKKVEEAIETIIDTAVEDTISHPDSPFSEESKDLLKALYGAFAEGTLREQPEQALRLAEEAKMSDDKQGQPDPDCSRCHGSGTVTPTGGMVHIVGEVACPACSRD